MDALPFFNPLFDLWNRLHKTLFSSKLTNGPIRLECLFVAGFYGHLGPYSQHFIFFVTY
jgi:hypothetical protein